MQVDSERKHDKATLMERLEHTICVETATEAGAVASMSTERDHGEDWDCNGKARVPLWNKSSVNSEKCREPVTLGAGKFGRTGRQRIIFVSKALRLACYASSRRVRNLQPLFVLSSFLHRLHNNYFL